MTADGSPSPSDDGPASTRRTFLAGAGAAAAAALAGCSAPGIETRVTESFEVAPEGATALAVRNRNGSVTVSGHDGDAVAVEVTKRGFGVGEGVLDDVVVEPSVTDGTLTLEAVYPPNADRVSTGIDVRLPASLTLREAETANGGVEASDVAGDATLRAGNGGVTARRVDGFLTLEAGNGAVEARDVGGIDGASAGNGAVDVEVPAIRGDTEISASNGGIQATIGPEVSAQFEARTTNGTVEVTGIELTDATISRSRVVGTLGEGGPSLTLRAGNGGIDVRPLD
jgi:hypothetical protein